MTFIKTFIIKHKTKNCQTSDFQHLTSTLCTSYLFTMFNAHYFHIIMNRMNNLTQFSTFFAKVQIYNFFYVQVFNRTSIYSYHEQFVCCSNIQSVSVVSNYKFYLWKTDAVDNNKVSEIHNNLHIFGNKSPSVIFLLLIQISK